MTRTGFLIVMIIIGALPILGMWWAWKAKKRRENAAFLPESPAPAGDPLFHDANAFYVSTTPAGEQLTRLTLPGLSFRGYSELTVYANLVRIRVRGEKTINIPLQCLQAIERARVRAGKAVEHEGLSVLSWTDSAGRTLESSFRLQTPGLQGELEHALKSVLTKKQKASAGR